MGVEVEEFLPRNLASHWPMPVSMSARYSRSLPWQKACRKSDPRRRFYRERASRGHGKASDISGSRRGLRISAILPAFAAVGGADLPAGGGADSIIDVGTNFSLIFGRGFLSGDKGVWKFFHHLTSFAAEDPGARAIRSGDIATPMADAGARPVLPRNR